MSNLNSKDRRAIKSIVSHMEKHPELMRVSSMSPITSRRIRVRRLHKLYVENLNFTSKQFTAALMVYNRKHGTKF